MIVITGAAGFIGSCMVGMLNSKGINNLIIVDDFSNERKNKNLENKSFTEKIHRNEFFKWLEKNYTQVAVAKLRLSNSCLNSLTQANTFFLQKNYTQAKTAYQEVLDLNPNDTYANQQIEKCNQLISSSSSPTLLLQFLVKFIT